MVHNDLSRPLFLCNNGIKHNNLIDFFVESYFQLTNKIADCDHFTHLNVIDGVYCTPAYHSNYIFFARKKSHQFKGQPGNKHIHNNISSGFKKKNNMAQLNTLRYVLFPPFPLLF